MTQEQTRGLLKWLAWGVGGGILLLFLIVARLLLSSNETPQARQARQLQERDSEQKRQNADMEEFRKKFKTEPGVHIPIVTKADFDAITPGMSYSRVSAMIRSPGEELSRSDIAGRTTIMYLWKNADGSNMNAMFQNDALVSKAQFGLR